MKIFNNQAEAEFQGISPETVNRSHRMKGKLPSRKTEDNAQSSGSGTTTFLDVGKTPTTAFPPNREKPPIAESIGSDGEGLITSKLLSRKQLSERAGVSVRLIDRLRDSEKLGWVQIGDRVMFTERNWLDYLNAWGIPATVFPPNWEKLSIAKSIGSGRGGKNENAY